MPPSEWYHKAQRDKTITMSPNQLVITKSTTLKAFGPIAAADSHQTSNKVEINKALPVILIKIDDIEVICGRYIER
jgi:hypothetical protein